MKPESLCKKVLGVCVWLLCLILMWRLSMARGYIYSRIVFSMLFKIQPLFLFTGAFEFHQETCTDCIALIMKQKK